MRTTIRRLESLVLSASAIRAVLIERGLRLTVADEDHLAATWPVRTARVVRDGLRMVVLRRNRDGEWRGALLLRSARNGFDLIAQEQRFRDLLHLAIWLHWCAARSAPTSVRVVPLQSRKVS